MSETNLFTPDQGEAVTESAITNQGDVAASTTPAPITPTIPQELSELVGEGKKYKTVEDAYKALPHQVNHISRIELENAQMREELTKRKTAEELLNDMRNRESTTGVSTPSVEVNQDVVSEIVRKQMEGYNKEQLSKSNTDSVVQAFKQNFGEKAEEMYNTLAKNNGMTIADVNAMAMRSPLAVLNLAGISSKKPVTSSFSSDVNTQSHSNSNTQTQNSRVSNYGSSVDVTNGMRRAIEMVNLRNKK